MLIDIHVHVVKQHGPMRTYGDDFTTPDEIIPMLDRAGIGKAVILPEISVECSHVVQSMQEVLDICAAYPDRFIPFCNLDPRMLTNSPEADFSYLFEFYKGQGCKGVGEVCTNLPFNDPLLENFFAHAEACELPLTFHIATQVGGIYGIVDELGLPLLEGALRKFPKLTFLGHSQAFWSHISADVNEGNWGGYPEGKVTPGRIVQLMREYPNLCGDMSAGSGWNAVARDPEFGYAFMAEFQDRLFFGTDICQPTNNMPLVPFFNEAHDKGCISQEVYEKIGWKNAEKLLGVTA
jgi:predicted TIM-barrel fold metal-dependent hydrolase